MMYLHPFPSIVDFTQLLDMMVKMKYYSEVITLIEKLESLRPKIYPDVYTMSVLWLTVFATWTECNMGSWC